MADVAELLLLIRGDASGAKGAMNDTHSGLLTLAKGVATVAAVFISAGAVAVKMATDFQASQTQLVTGAGESEKNLGMVSAGILAMAGSVGQSATDLSKGMFLIEFAGYHGADGLAVLKAAAEGAATGGAQMTTVADALTTAMHDYNIPVNQANAVTSALVQTVADGKTNLQDLASSLGKVMPVASALGVSFQDVTGAMATMTNAGLSARFAASHLQNTLLALSAPSAGATKALKGIGLTTSEVKATLDGPGGLGAAISIITEFIGKKFPAGSVASVAAFKAIMGGATGYSTALMLGQGKGMEFAANVQNIGKVLHGSNAEVQGFSLASHDFGFAMKAAGDAAGAAMITMGTKLLPVLTVVATWVGKEIPVALGIAENAFNWLGTNVLPVIVGAFTSVSQWVEKNRLVFLAIGKLLLGAVATAFTATTDAIKFVAKNFQIVGPILAGVIAGFVAFKVAMGIQSLITGVGAAIGLLQAGMGGLEVSEGAAATTSYGLGAALTVATGPIGLVVAGIALLVAGFVLAYTHVQGFRDVVNAVFSVVVKIVQTAVGVVVGIFKTEFAVIFAVIGGITTAVQAVIKFLAGGPIGTAFKAAFAVVTDVINGVVALIGTVVTGIQKVIGFLGILGHSSARFVAGGGVAKPGSLNPLARIAVRDSGGDVTANTPYWIGAPEVFVPKVSGTILNAAQLRSLSGGPRPAAGGGSGPQVVYNAVFNGVGKETQDLIDATLDAQYREIHHLISAARR